MKSRAGDVLNGKYAVERQLAKGGMGSVWIARDLKLGRRVAVKFIDIVPGGEHDAASIRARFEREAMAVARLSTPHVVQIFDSSLDSETPYIVMECLEGEDLRQRLAREPRLSFPVAVGIMNQAARGLRAAHEAGIVHRDLKPANVFLAQVDHEQVVKILDFGIAKLLDHRAVTVDGEVFGSARWMSPEQIMGAKDLDLRSDLWSMGVILYRAITGSDPFGGDIVKTVQSLRLGDFPRATSAVPELVPEVDAFFARALAVDKRRRFLSALEMAEAFAELAEKQVAATGARSVRGFAPPEPPFPTATVVENTPPADLEPARATTRIEVVQAPLGDRTDPLPPPGDTLPDPRSSGPVTERIEAASRTSEDDLFAPRSSPDQETLTATTREASSMRQSRRFRAGWIALAAVALLGTCAALRPRTAAIADVHPAAPQAPEAVLPPAGSVAPQPVPRAEPDPEKAEPEAAGAPPAAPDDPGASADAPEAPPSASAVAPARRAAKPKCDPPWFIDARGAKRLIKGCY